MTATRKASKKSLKQNKKKLLIQTMRSKMNKWTTKKMRNMIRMKKKENMSRKRKVRWKRLNKLSCIKWARRSRNNRGIKLRNRLNRKTLL